MNTKTGVNILFLLFYCGYGMMLLFILASCKKEEDTVQCDPINIVYSTTASDSCIEKGAITIQSPVGVGYTYKAGNLPFQASPVISSLLPGEHKVFVQTPDGCLDSTTIVIAKVAAGPLFTAAKNVFTSYCFPCHTGSNPQAGYDWARSCDILNQWSRIKARAVDGNPAPMPPSGLIPQAERDKIMNWINAGHQLED